MLMKRTRTRRKRTFMAQEIQFSCMKTVPMSYTTERPGFTDNSRYKIVVFYKYSRYFISKLFEICHFMNTWKAR